MGLYVAVCMNIAQFRGAMKRSTVNPQWLSITVAQEKESSLL